MKRRWNPKWGLGLLVLTLLSAHLVAGLSAKYVARDGAMDGGRAAAFSFDLTNGDNSAIIDLGGVKKPGDSEVYRFHVTNSSEVAMRYWLGVSINGSMPLECSITRNDSSVVATTFAELEAAVPDALPLTASSAPVTMPPNAEGVQYTLTVTWPAEANDLEYANDSVGELTLRVLAEQVD